MGLVDATSLWKRETSAETGAAILVAGIYINKKRDVSDQRGPGRKLMGTTVTANEIFEEARMKC